MLMTRQGEFYFFFNPRDLFLGILGKQSIEDVWKREVHGKNFSH